MAHDCCSTMMTLSSTRDELTSRFGPDHAPNDDWEPLVEWSEASGIYLIGQTAIYFCPWCGSELPNHSDAALAEVERHGLVIKVDDDGNVHATLAGEPVDHREILSRLAPPKDET